MREEISFCRICSGLCGIRLEIDDNDRIVRIKPDKSHPLTRGYSCAKGIVSGELHNSPERVLRPLKRQPDGSFEAIPLAQALDEIAARVRALADRDGPRSVAAYLGTAGYSNATAAPLLKAWLDALGSPSRFTSLTVDQSAKIVTIGRMGRWSAGRQAFADADVWMMFGANPLVSLSNTAGLPVSHPLKQLKEARARGMRLVVIDPRRTETARYADIHLQPYPGQDPAIAAGLLNIMLQRNLYDREFCDRHVDDMEGLRAAVAPFTPERVAAQAGISADDLVAAAEMWGGGGKRGCAATSTGTCMSGFSNLSDHLIELLNVVCGRYLAAGDPVANALLPGPRRAEVLPSARWWERGLRGRSRDFGTLPGMIGREFPCGIMADEILAPGEGRIRSLFVVGGNPAVAFPDQRKVVRALRSLDLLVCVEPFMTATAQLAHYIIPPRLQYERADSTPVNGQIDLLPVPFLQFTPEIVKPPQGSEVIDEWRLFWSLGQRLGFELNVNGVALDMREPPTTKELIDILSRDRAIPFEEVWNERQGRVFKVERAVEPGRPDRAARFSVMPEDVARELREFGSRRAGPGGFDSGGKTFTHILASRRMRDMMNSVGRASPTIHRRHPFNPAYIHPDDIAALGLQGGDRVEIVSDHGHIEAVVEPDASLRQGVVQMSHAWGGLPDQAGDYAKIGANVGLLISNDDNVESINAMARQSGIPVNILPAR